jgi:ribosomal protein S18 acetylase RimI-like enzyme
VAVLPRLVREAEDRGWWRAVDGPAAAPSPASSLASAGVAGPAPDPGVAPTVRTLVPDDLRRLRVADRVVSPSSPDDVRALLVASISDDTRVIAAVSGESIVGLAVAAASVGGGGGGGGGGVESLLAVGVAPQFRGAGLGGALLRELVAGRPTGTSLEARIGVAERDVVEPLPIETRIAIARRLLAGAGFEVRRPSPDDVRDDPWTLRAELPPA